MPQGKLDPPLSPIDSLLDELFLLKFKLAKSNNGALSSSTIDMYNDMVTSSEHGRKCQYSIKTETIFMAVDYQNIRESIIKLYQLIQQIDNSLK